jgi:bifunctional DNase/RNase
MSLVKLTIKGISYSQTQHGAYALILKEVDGEVNLPIVIGAFEAQSIAIAIEGEIKPPRPLTHDLFKNFADVFGITIKQVIIHKLVDGVFYSSIICERDKIEEILDARTSDAIALALRFNTPIFTYQNILDKAGIYLNKTKDAMDDSISNPDLIIEQSHAVSSDDEFVNMDTNELEKLMNEAVLNEDYEKAAKIRDAISKR